MYKNRKKTTMNKKQYLAPSMETVNIATEQTLLVGSETINQQLINDDPITPEGFPPFIQL